MIKRLFIITKALLLCAAVSSLPGAAQAAMSGSNYSIPNAVLSGGGAPSGSANYQMDSTLGQSSALPDQSTSMSGAFDLYPGFWQAQAAGPPLIPPTATATLSGTVVTVTTLAGSELIDLTFINWRDRLVKSHQRDYADYSDSSTFNHDFGAGPVPPAVMVMMRTKDDNGTPADTSDDILLEYFKLRVPVTAAAN